MDRRYYGTDTWARFDRATYLPTQSYISVGANMYLGVVDRLHFRSLYKDVLVLV